MIVEIAMIGTFTVCIMIELIVIISYLADILAELRSIEFYDT